MIMKLSIVSSVFILILLKNTGFTICELIGTSGQVCPGSQLMYTCTTVGAGATVWSGSAFQCPSSDRITLLHSEFITQSGASGTCNNGVITGHSLRVVNNNFVSQLNVTVSSSFDGKSIQCSHDNGVTITVTGTRTISIATDSLPPPSNVYLSEVHFGKLTFSWNSVIPIHCNDCQIQYDIIATNCGVCPLRTTNSSVVCETGIVAGQINICTLLLQTVICGSVYGNISNPSSILVKVPSSPKVLSIPRYSATTQTLIKVTSTFEEEEPFTIFDGIDGSATSYTVNYFQIDSMANNTCGSALIPSSSCKHGTCKHILDISSLSHCLTAPISSIGVTVFATNILGNGVSSDPVFIVYTNDLLRILFHICISTATCICTFYNEELSSEKSCSIVYSLDKSFSHSNEIRVVENILSTITIDLPPFPYSHDHVETTLYYIATGSHKNYTIEMEGNFSVECTCDINQLGDSLALTSMPDACNSHLYYIGIKNGAVCYNDTKVGSVAVYFCFGCGRSSTKPTLVRVCQPHGEWNGTVHQCQPETLCSDEHMTDSLTLVLSISLMGLVIIAVVTTSIVAIAILARAKARIMHSLRTIEDSKVEAIYEDISLSHDQPVIGDTITRNTAYDTCAPGDTCK